MQIITIPLYVGFPAITEFSGFLKFFYAIALNEVLSK